MSKKNNCIDIGELLASIPDPPSLHSELFKVDDNLIAEIYNVVEKILRNPPLYAWYRYKIKDFITQLPTGRWEPDLEAIKNIKIYYDVYS